MSAIGTMTLTLSYDNGKFVGRYSKIANNGEMTTGTLPETTSGSLAALVFPSQVQQAGATVSTGAETTTKATSAAAASLTSSLADLKVSL